VDETANGVFSRYFSEMVTVGVPGRAGTETFFPVFSAS
jgi:hypothetical protein